ncbi:MAG: phosphomannomutase [Pseudomonadota bacterium]
MAPKFGTSGLRGLVVELNDDIVAGYVAAFLEGSDTNGTVLIGRDLRSSSERIGRAVAGAVAAGGHTPLDCGVLPTPALALAAMERSTAAVMVTGSHIPDDRNGLKFYSGGGEITKADETAIAGRVTPLSVTPVAGRPDATAREAYIDRYTMAFRPETLHGLRIGVYEHSSAARDILGDVLRKLGAEAVALGRADAFVPVDTEALSGEMRSGLAGWAREHGLDAIVSTDGDADRPMLADAEGRVIPGDRLGPLTARWAGAETVVTPVSSNTLVDAMGEFAVIRTRIGSPFVIAGMGEADGRTVGYEANGGLLLGFEGPGSLAPLPTRDALLPILAPLTLAVEGGVSVADLAAGLPPRFTAADRLTDIPRERALALVDALESDDELAARIYPNLGAPVAIDRTDGRRAHFADGRIVHLRPSGNAPEFRVYTEAESEARAGETLTATLTALNAALRD